MEEGGEMVVPRCPGSSVQPGATGHGGLHIPPLELLLLLYSSGLIALLSLLLKYKPATRGRLLIWSLSVLGAFEL